MHSWEVAKRQSESLSGPEPALKVSQLWTQKHEAGFQLPYHLMIQGRLTLIPAVFQVL